MRAARVLLFAALACACTPTREATPEVAPEVSQRRAAVTIEVHAGWPGHSAVEVEPAVAQPLERALADLPGATRVSSESSADGATITVVLALDADVERSRIALHERLASAKATLPADVSPEIGPDLDPDAPAVLFTVMAGANATASLFDVGAQLRAALLPVPGVAALDLCGERESQLVLTLDADRLAAHGLTVAAVTTQVGAALIDPLAPGLHSPRSLEVEELLRIGVGAEGSSLRLADVAAAELRPAVAGCHALRPGHGQVLLGSLRMRRGAAAAEWNMAVQARLTTLTEELGVRGVVVDAPDTPVRVALELSSIGTAAETTERHAPALAAALASAGLADRVALLRVGSDEPPGTVIDAELWIAGTVAPGPLRTLERALATSGLQVRAIGASGADSEDPSRSTLVISGDELEVLRRLADESAAIVGKLPGVEHASVRPAAVPGLRIEVANERLAQLGVGRAELARTIAAALVGVPVAPVKIGDRVARVIVAVGEPGRGDLAARLAVAGPLELGTTATRTRVDTLAQFHLETQPTQVTRVDGRRTMTVELRLREPSTLTAVQQAIAAGLQLPVGYVVTFEP